MNQFARAEQPTLADVIALLQSDAGLSSSRRATAIRNIETACCWFGMAPADVIAHPMNIRPRFVRLSPGGLGVSNKRIQNVRSSLKSSLRRVNLIDGRSFKVPLAAEWRALMVEISDDYRRRKVRCIASFASARGLAPDGIDDAFSTDLLAALQADRLHSNPRITHQNAVRAWNALADKVSGWPQRRLVQPRYGKIKSPNASMHPSLQRAIDRFLVRNSTDDPFDLSAPDLPWKASTVGTYRAYLKRYFGLLVTLGHAPNDLQSLSALVSFDRVKAALMLLMEQNGGKSRVGASHIARLLSQVVVEAARLEPALSVEQRKAVAADAQSLRQLADRLHTRNKTLGQKIRKRLAPLREEANMARLFLLPFAVAKQVQQTSAPTRGQALQMQWALALMILTFCPLRISSLCQLQIDRHLVWTRPGMKGDLRLEFAWRELKSDAPEVLPLPAECARMVRLYIEHFRPKLNQGSSTYLFPGRQKVAARLGASCQGSSRNWSTSVRVLT